MQCFRENYPEEVVYISQKSIGISLRSTPATYLGVADDIRKLFWDAGSKLQELSNSDADIEEFSKAFETFSEEFEAMILKEEAILLMILLETFTQDD